MKVAVGAIVLVGVAATLWVNLDTQVAPDAEPSSVVAKDGDSGADSDQTYPAAKVYSQPEESLGTEQVETEVVMGLRVRKDRNCDVTQHYVDIGNGTVVEAFSCKPRSDLPESPYEAFTTETLLGLAYNSADAAAEVSKRLHELNPSLAHEYALRAVALDPDNVAPIRWLIAASHGTRGESDEARSAIANSYILTRIAREFDSSVSSDWLAREALDYGFTQDDLERFDTVAMSQLKFIREIQIEVYGTTTVEGEGA